MWYVVDVLASIVILLRIGRWLIAHRIKRDVTIEEKRRQDRYSLKGW